jgi:uncharacterized protein (DUF2126 family)
VHAPLVFDIIDRWNEQSIGRCTYHVKPPAGRVYTTRPVNIKEAEDRRHERFQVSDGPPGLMTAPAEEINPHFPMTLDLRLPVPTERPHTKKQGLV